MKIKHTQLIAFVILLCFYLKINSQITNNKWKEDLSELISKIESTHPKPYHHISKNAFYTEANKIKNSFNKDSIGNQIKMMKLVSLLRDRHTALYPNKNGGFNNWLPISIYKFEDGFYIVSAIKKYKELIGAQIINLNKTSVNKVFELTADLHASDNNIGRQLNTYYMSNLEVLNYYNIIKHKNYVNLKLKLPNNNEKTVNIEPVKLNRNLHLVLDYAEFFGPMNDSLYSNYHIAYKNLNLKEYYQKPLSEKSDIPHFIRNRRGYWYDYIKEHNTMYIAICFSTNNSRNGFNSFNDFLKEVFTKIDKNAINKVVVDIRFNPGGDGSTTLPLVHEFIKRDSINKKGKLFVLTGRKTYSAAQMIFAEMIKHTNTLLVGEPAGAPVNGYGDPSSFKLKNSKMNYQISTAYWQMGHPNDSSWEQSIDIPFVFNSKDYFNGKDRALEYILSLNEDFKTLPNILKNNTKEAFKKEFKNRKQAFNHYPWWKPFDEREMRYTARNLFDKGQQEKALLGFETLIEMYPESWRAYRDYAKRAIKINKFKKAKELILKGLKVNPSSNDLKDLLKKVPNKN